MNKILDTINNQKNNHQKQKITKRKEKMEAESEIIQKRKENILKKQEDMQAEKMRLLALDDKELLVELIFSIRGMYAQIKELETQQQLLDERLGKMEFDIALLEDEIATLNQKNN